MIIQKRNEKIIEQSEFVKMSEFSKCQNNSLPDASDKSIVQTRVVNLSNARALCGRHISQREVATLLTIAPICQVLLHTRHLSIYSADCLRCRSQVKLGRDKEREREKSFSQALSMWHLIER